MPVIKDLAANEIVGMDPGEFFVHYNVASTTIVQHAWHREQPLAVHAWIYGLADDLIRDLGATLRDIGDLSPTLRLRAPGASPLMMRHPAGGVCGCTLMAGLNRASGVSAVATG